MTAIPDDGHAPRALTSSSANAGKVDVPPDLTLGDQRAFEAVYASAGGDADKVPWADLRPCPMLVDWLNTSACGLVRPGARAIVIGAGLGDDVMELSRRGYDVIGFDISPTAVHWAQQRHAEIADRLVTADLLCMPGRWLRRFDLVVEINTVQSHLPARRGEVCRAVASLLAPHGLLFLACRTREDSQSVDDLAGPPWALTSSEVAELMEDVGLAPVGSGRVELDDEAPPRARYVGVFTRV